MNKIKKGLLSMGVGLVLMPLFAPLESNVVHANFEGYSSKCSTQVSDDGDTAGADSGAAVTTGDWLTKGSDTNKNAQQIFDFLTKKIGFSGAGAAGVLAVALRESGFNPKAQNTGGGVAGIFQWSGFSNSVNGSRITAEGSIKAGDTSTLTMENELKLVRHELNGGWAKVKFSVGKATDPVDATLNWSRDYEGVALSDSQTKVGDISANARAAYEAFGGAKISANSALLGATDAANTGDVAAVESENSGCQSYGNSGSDIVNIAKSLLGYFTYGQQHAEALIGSVASPKRDGMTDCSGFVWLVLVKAGYKVPANMGWFTQTMEADAKGDHKWLKEIPESEAGPGDIVIVNTGSGAGDNGHTAIIEQKWKGNNTKIINMGGVVGSKGVSEATFQEAFLGLLNKGGKPVFARPVKK